MANRRPWSELENRLFLELKKQGLSLPQIRFKMAEAGYFHSENSIENKSRRLKASLRGDKTPTIPALKVLPPEVTEFTHAAEPIIRTAWLYDVHFPQHIPVEPFLDFMDDFKPHIFGLGGDIWSLDCVSHWNEGGFKNIGYDNVMKMFADERIRFRAFIEKFRERMPNATFVYITGNHEIWIEQFLQSFPQIDRPSLAKVLQGLDIEIIPHGGAYKIGQIHFMHGDQFGTINPAKQAVERCYKSVVFGHHHVFKVWPAYSMLDELEKHVGIQVPCYCKLAPEYGKGKPNAWHNGFFTASIKRESGKFSPHVQLVSPKGEFMTQMGVEYHN